MFVLNKNIRVGDIVLVDSNSLMAKGIKTQGRGDYSHAAIVISDSQLIEALGKSGVQISSLLRYEVDDISNLAVYRAKDIDQKKFSALIDEAIELQGKGYDLVGALKSMLPFGKTQENKFFCSELVAHLYNEMGIKLFDKDNAKVKPNDFARCSKLKNVSSEAISELEPYIKKRYEKRPHLWRPIDNKNSSVSPDALRHQKFLKDAQKIFKEKNLDIPEKVDDIIEIMTRPHEDGIVRLDLYLSNDLMDLIEKHQIMEGLEADINKDIDDDLEDYQKELDELGVKFAIQELEQYKKLLIMLEEKFTVRSMEATIINELAKEYQANFIQIRAEYYAMIAMGVYNLATKQIGPRIDFLKKHIEKQLQGST